MAYTANKNLEQVARGANVGTWDTPTNANWGIVDQSFGGVATVALTNSPVTLSPTQYQCAFITLTGAISANIAITLPAVGSFYTVQNLTTNTSAFYVTMTTTAAGGETIGLPPGEPTEIFTDGTNVKFRALGRVGTYWDYAGSSVPSWVSACTLPPYLNCDGTSFSSATYPVLAAIFGGTTLPDARGRYRATLNQTTNRITSSAGVDGNTARAAGGNMSAGATLSASMIPAMSAANGYITDPGHAHSYSVFVGNNQSASGGNQYNGNNSGATTGTATTGITVGSASPAGLNLQLPPTYIGGITMIRAA